MGGAVHCAAVEAVCTDMHRPYVNAVAEVLPKAAVVFDKFHVLQHAANAIDEVRRQEFFRAGPVMRKYGRGKRWLLLHRWRDVRGSKRRELQELFDASWRRALRWQRLPEMNKLGEFLLRHLIRRRAERSSTPRSRDTHPQGQCASRPTS